MTFVLLTVHQDLQPKTVFKEDRLFKVILKYNHLDQK